METSTVQTKEAARQKAATALDRACPDGVPDTDEALSKYLEAVTLNTARTLIDAEVTSLCGERYKRNRPDGSHCKRHASNPGSIVIDGVRVRIRVPRVRDHQSGKERPLNMYRALHRPSKAAQEKMTQAIILGLSQRDYKKMIKKVEDCFGFSSSTINRVFIERSAAALEAFEKRLLSEDTYVALLIDGKYLKDRQIVLCVGITEEGDKKALGFAEASTENAEAVEGLLQDLVERGLSYEEGVLCVVDGGKGIRKAITNVFGAHAQVQRCMQHKLENVTSHLSSKEDQQRVRRQLNKAYRQDTYEKAKKAVTAVQKDLRADNQQKAANSLAEGLEETLTLHRLGVAKELGVSLRTTNIIENVNSSLGRRCRRITRWQKSSQRQRWVAMAILTAEPGLKRLRCAEHLPKLQKALAEEVRKSYIPHHSGQKHSPQK